MYTELKSYQYVIALLKKAVVKVNFFNICCQKIAYIPNIINEVP